jgi:hypothetical protein
MDQLQYPAVLLRVQMRVGTGRIGEIDDYGKWLLLRLLGIEDLQASALQ